MTERTKSAEDAPLLYARIEWIVSDARERQASADYLFKRDGSAFAEGRASAWGEISNLLYAALNMPADVAPSELEKTYGK